MSGHSKWANIKHKKALADSKKGKVFTTLARAITIAAGEGGDPEINVALRLAVDKARSANMPKDNIERAIKKGTGEDKDGVELESILYEGYAPHGIALMIDTVTDNRNRTVAELRHVLNRANGNLGENGSVAWQFTRMSYFSFPIEDRNEDELFELAVEAGADDVVFEGGFVEIIAAPEAFKEIGDFLRTAGIETDEAGLRMIPNQEMELGVSETLRVMKVIEEVEELDDVQKVDANLSISEDALAQMEAA